MAVDLEVAIALRPIFVCGATASGKSCYAVQLAEQLDGEIVNGDAFQIYRGIETLSAAPNQQDQRKVPHHLFGILAPGDDCNAGRFCRFAEPIITAIQSRGKVPIVVGGSGLYLKFLSHGASPLPMADEVLRSEMDQLSLDELLNELERLDPVEAQQVDRTNRRYVSRALEICRLTGEKASKLRDGWEQVGRNREKKLKGVWLRWPRERLHARIAQRTKTILESGAIDEVAKLTGIRGNWEKAIGSQEIRSFLAGEITKSRCEELIIFATRQYAKRQETWFRRENWLEVIEQ